MDSMHRFGLTVVMGGLVAIGCKMDNPAFVKETEGDASSGADPGGTRGPTSESSDSSTDSDTTGTSGSDGSAGSDGTTGPDPSPTGPDPTSTAPTAGTTDGTGSTGGASTGGASTGGDPACGLEEGTELLVKAKANGVDRITTCGGQAISVSGPAFEVGSGHWTVRNCGDSCETSCSGEEVLFEFFGDPAAFPSMPDCAVVRMDQYHPVGVDACDFSGIVIEEMFQPSRPPLYVAARETETPPTGISLQVVPELLPEPECSCEQEGCCAFEPGMYELWFATSKSSLSLQQGEYVVGEYFLGQLGNLPYEVHVLRAHAHEVCAERPHFDWVVRREWSG